MKKISKNRSYARSQAAAAWLRNKKAYSALVKLHKKAVGVSAKKDAVTSAVAAWCVSNGFAEPGREDAWRYFTKERSNRSASAEQGHKTRRKNGKTHLKAIEPISEPVAKIDISQMAPDILVQDGTISVRFPTNLLIEIAQREITTRLLETLNSK